MALNLYRHHRKECEGAHPEDTRTGQFEEGRRNWKKCGCLIHVSGTLGGKFNRRQTGKADWNEAKALVALWEEADSWDGQDKIEAPLPLPAGRSAHGAARVALRDSGQPPVRVRALSGVCPAGIGGSCNQMSLKDHGERYRDFSTSVVQRYEWMTSAHSARFLLICPLNTGR